VRVAVHAIYGDVPTNCPLGCREPELRKRWGCDAPAGSPVVRITCTGCAGAGDRDGTECETCNGSGTEPIFRCPQSFSDRDLSEAFSAYNQFDARGILPAGDAWLGQSAQFCAFVAAVDSERGAIERAHETVSQGG
jgi:hypothetical protein